MSRHSCGLARSRGPCPSLRICWINVGAVSIWASLPHVGRDMRADEWFAQEEQLRSVTSPATRRMYGVGVRVLQQQEAEEYMRDSVACPRCGSPVSIRGAHDSVAEYCRSCAQTKRFARERNGYIRTAPRERPPEDPVERACWEYAKAWRDRHAND